MEKTSKTKVNTGKLNEGYKRMAENDRTIESECAHISSEADRILGEY